MGNAPMPGPGAYDCPSTLSVGPKYAGGLMNQHGSRGVHSTGRLVNSHWLAWDQTIWQGCRSIYSVLFWVLWLDLKEVWRQRSSPRVVGHRVCSGAWPVPLAKHRETFCFCCRFGPCESLVLDIPM